MIKVMILFIIIYILLYIINYYILKKIYNNSLKENFENDTINNNFYTNNLSKNTEPYLSGINVVYTTNKSLDGSIFNDYVFNGIKINTLPEQNILNDFTNSNYNIALILDHDCTLDFKKYWDNTLKEIIDNAPTDWDIIILTYDINDLTHPILDWTNNNNYILNDSDFSGTKAYIINKKGSLKIFNKYNDKPIKYIYKYPYFIYNKNKLKNKFIEKYTEKENKVPKTIFQTWHAKTLPPKMKKCVNDLISNNKDYNYYIYDDNQCRNMIKENFNESVLNAYDNLIPGAYKADLWRYCALYAYGGIYIDIKFRPIGDFSFNELISREHMVLDRPCYKNAIKISLKDEINLIRSPKYNDDVKYLRNKMLVDDKNNIGIYNALMICKKYSPLLLKCINKVIYNVKNKIYGNSSLYPTGPLLVSEQYFEGDNERVKNIELFHSINGLIIINKITGKAILEHYPEYRDEQQKTSKIEHYGKLWNKRKIYK